MMMPEPIELIGDEIGLKAFWMTIGARPVGATIVTSRSAAGPAGFLGLSFAHVSAAPPTVLVSIGRTTRALEVIGESRAFAACVLPAGSEEIARAFGSAANGEDRFASHEWESFVTGAPVLPSAAAVLDCRLNSIIELEAAMIAIGRVGGVRIASDRGATIAYGGGYRDL